MKIFNLKCFPPRRRSTANSLATCDHRSDESAKKCFVSLQPAAMNMIPAQMQIPGLDMSANLHSAATEVLCLMNMVETDELMDDEEYEGKFSVDGVHFADVCYSSLLPS